MNTTEVKFTNQIKNFPELFILAKEQFLNYEKIEGIEDWKAHDFSIDCAEDQARFKNMLQVRFIEELTEASISISEPDEHFWEEIGDAINFFLSGFLMVRDDLTTLKQPVLYKGSHTKTKPNNLLTFSMIGYPVIEKVGYLCNLLKNREWAQSNYLVSMYDFDIRLNELWDSFWEFLRIMNVTEKDVFEMVYKKVIVNRHRIESGY